MIARATIGQIQEGKMRDVIDFYNDSLATGLKSQKGFERAYLMTDASSGKALSITVWESEADLAAAGGVLQDAVAKVSESFATGSFETTNYDLSVEQSMSDAGDAKFARTGTGVIQQGKMDEVISLLRETNYPAYASQQGFKGAMLLTQSGTGKSISITLWESEADTKAGDARNQEHRQAAREAQDNPPVVDYYELSAQA